MNSKISEALALMFARNQVTSVFDDISDDGGVFRLPFVNIGYRWDKDGTLLTQNVNRMAETAAIHRFHPDGTVELLAGTNYGSSREERAAFRKIAEKLAI